MTDLFSPRAERGIAPRHSALCRLISLLVLASPTAAVTFTVTNNNDSGPGSLRQAVLDANARGPTSNTINFAAALEAQTITLASQISFSAANSTLSIDASALYRGITISGGGATRIFLLVSPSSQLSLNRLRLVRGYATTGQSSDGGAIRNNGGQLVLTNCIFTDNVATGDGGAVWSDSGPSCSINATGCTFDRNSALDSGALYLAGSGVSSLSACTFTGNRGTTAGATGAITLFNAMMTMNHVTVFENTGDISGGGIYFSGTLALNRCLIAGNSAVGANSTDLYRAASSTINTNGNPNLLGSNGTGQAGDVSASFPAGPLVGTPAARLDPKLRPLGPSGGFTQTLAPLYNSPALDAGGSSPFTADQRGYPRNVGSGSDLGAVERGPIILVTNTQDNNGSGSLRAALDATSAPDTRVQFAPALSGGTIKLLLNTLSIGSRSVEIDGSMLSSPLTISGNAAYRIFDARGFVGDCLSLNRLILADARAYDGVSGAAFYSRSVDFLAVDCTFLNNESDKYGGAILLNAGATAAMHRCTFSGNSAVDGGAISDLTNGLVSLTNCTISDNRASGGTAGVHCVVGGELELTHTTVTKNAGAFHGGVYLNNSPLRLERSLLADNTGGNSPDLALADGATVLAAGPSLIGNNGGSGADNVSAQFPASALVGTPSTPVNAALGPLLRTGGFTDTRSPSQGSPALNAAGVSRLTSDQRGFPRGVGGASDLGAVERGPFLTVSVTANSGNGTLRNALLAATAADSTILFDPALNGASIPITGSPLPIVAGQSVQIDASAFSNGLRLTGDRSTRIFVVPNGASLTLNRVTLTGGNTSGAGGAINSSGIVSLFACDLFGNSANDGGALFSTAGTAELVGCRVAGNEATNSASQLGLSGGRVTAVDCWFASNAPASSSFSPGVGYAPFIILTHVATPDNIPVGSSATLIASVRTNSYGQTVSLDRLFPLIGRSVVFSGAMKGNISAAQNVIQADGTAMATFTGTSEGTATATVTVDSDAVTAALTVTAAPTPTPTPSATPTPSPTPVPAKLGNVSTRLRVETGDNVLIGGFIISGAQPKKVIVRALGPSLPLANNLANPTLELYGPTGNLLASNDNWRSTQEAEIIGSTVPPPDDLESAIVAILPANNSAYTAIVRGVSNGTGAALVEVYDLDPSADSRLANISTRGFVQTGDDVMIGGFIVTGSGSRKVIVRAIGPSLPVAGKMADPTLDLYDANGAIVGSNDNWRTGGQEAEIIASTVPPTDDSESAIVATLPNTAHTVIVRGANGSTGVALVEVYSLD